METAARAAAGVENVLGSMTSGAAKMTHLSDFMWVCLSEKPRPQQRPCRTMVPIREKERRNPGALSPVMWRPLCGAAAELRKTRIDLHRQEAAVGQKHHAAVIGRIGKIAHDQSTHRKI